MGPTHRIINLKWRWVGVNYQNITLGAIGGWIGQMGHKAIIAKALLDVPDEHSWGVHRERINMENVRIVVKLTDPVHTVEADVKARGGKGFCGIGVAMRPRLFARVAPLNQIVIAAY